MGIETRNFGLYSRGFTYVQTDMPAGYYGPTETYEWTEGFEDGNLNDWVVEDSGFEIKTNNVYEGTYSAGIEKNSANLNIAYIVPSVISGGKQLSVFEFYWYETTDSTGGGIQLIDSDGTMIVGFASDNPQWYLDDGDGQTEIYDSDSTYQVWTYVKFTFDWENRQYDYHIEDMSGGHTETGTRSLVTASNIEKIYIKNYAGGWASGDMYMWFDNLYLTYDYTPIYNEPEKTDSWFNPVTGEVRIYNGHNWKEIRDFELWGSGSDYGYICGGDDGTNAYSTIDRIIFPFDSGTASNVGNLSGSRRLASANNSSTHGYICGGDDGTNRVSTIDRIIFPFDSGTANNVGNLTGSRNGLSANNSSTHGYICGGYDGTNSLSTIDRITFPFDSGTASNVGNLSGSRRRLSANNSSTHGYIYGGDDESGSTWYSTIDRITFPFDSGTANHVGNLSGSRRGLSANNSSIHGYICGGDEGTNEVSTIDRITFPFDSGSATNVGNLTSNTVEVLSANNSSTHGYICGGAINIGSPSLSTIDAITFPFDSGNANQIGNLSGTRRYLQATDGCDFVNHLTGPIPNKITP